MKKYLIMLFAMLMAVLCISAIASAAVTFNVELSKKVADIVQDGRAFVIISSNGASEPRNQISATGVPFWGKTVNWVFPGSKISFADGDSTIVGYPFEKISDIPAGEYYVQAFFAVYATYYRSDGKVIKAELPGEGGPERRWSNPGNFYSTVKKVYIDPKQNIVIDLSLENVVQPANPLKPGEVIQQGNYPDTTYVKYVKIKSELLSKFWGTDMYIGANILLPSSYFTNPTAKYPVWYQHGHWPGGRAPLSFSETNAFGKTWLDSNTAQMIVVEIRHSNPYYGCSYAVNSANVGPYGDAITKELIPYLESQFRMVPEGWARLLAGGSTGGWEAMALQSFYPDYFGGAWANCPDSLDFRYHQIVNIYSDPNAYYIYYNWTKVERPSARKTDGNINYTMKMENDMERAMGGDEAVSGGQWAIWEAVYGPVGADGYPERIWNPVTGAIDKKVAEYWKNYDLRYYLETNWKTVGPKLVGKIHIRDGEMDTYYLNLGVYMMQNFLESTKEPYYDGYVKTFSKLGHTGNISNADLLTEMAQHLIKYGPSWVKGVLYPNAK